MVDVCYQLLQSFEINNWMPSSYAWILHLLLKGPGVAYKLNLPSATEVAVTKKFQAWSNKHYQPLNWCVRRSIRYARKLTSRLGMAAASRMAMNPAVCEIPKQTDSSQITWVVPGKTNSMHVSISVFAQPIHCPQDLRSQGASDGNHSTPAQGTYHESRSRDDHELLVSPKPISHWHHERCPYRRHQSSIQSLQFHRRTCPGDLQPTPHHLPSPHILLKNLRQSRRRRRRRGDRNSEWLRTDVNTCHLKPHRRNKQFKL